MFYGQLEVDRYLFENYLPHKRKGFFVECGAFDGQCGSVCKFFEESRGWAGVNIEPVPELFALCEKQRPHSLNLNCALAGTNETRNFTHVLTLQSSWYLGVGSLCHTRKHHDSLVGRGHRMVTFPVQCRTFASIAEEHKLPEVDLFVLDVEGTELDALSGILCHATPPKLFCIEHNHVGRDALCRVLANRYALCGSYHADSVFRRID